MFDKRLFRQVDISLPIIALLLVIFGLVMISSATHVYLGGQGSVDFIQRQIISAIIGFLLMMFILYFDYRIFKDYALFIYGGALILLFSTLFLSGEGIAAQRSIFLGPISFQPSELAKIGLIIFLSSFLSDEKGKITHTTLIKVCVATLLPFFLIIRSDLGTALVLWVIALVILFVAGFSGIWLMIISGALGGTMITWIAIHLRFGLWIPLKEYQLMRLLIFLNPGMDPFGYGYHLIQSKIAIGSGGILGKGLYSGTQNRLNFLPEQHTDFIYSVVGEELGFIGAAILIFLYFLLIRKGLQVAAKAKDSFGVLMAIGITAMLGFHIIVNIGMTMGILPITGIPLPFVSYGGSSLTTNLLAIGLLMNVYMRRQKILF